MSYVVLVDARSVNGLVWLVRDAGNSFHPFRTERDAVRGAAGVLAPERQVVVLDVDRLPWRSCGELEIAVTAGSRIPHLVEEDLRPSGVGLPPRMEGP